MTALFIIGLVFAVMAAVLHLAFFVLESVLFRMPVGRRIFGVRPENDSAPLRLFAVNQGVYNLGLAIVVLVGIVLVLSHEWWGFGLIIVITGCSLMVLAGIALAVTAPKRMLPIALAQGGVPLLAITALVLNG
jgi:putative membrane protein